jgi:lipoate-protein ligase A
LRRIKNAWLCKSQPNITADGQRVNLNQMLACDLTLPSPRENLACDEALLALCEKGEADELLRLWEPSQYFVVVGYGNRVRSEVSLPFCQQHTIQILRRCTGGGTVLQGPGVFNYSLVLRGGSSSPVHTITAANNFILKRHQAALAALLRAPVEIRGHTDLAIGGLKFSGNSQRRGKHFLLFHGSFLLNFDLELMEKVLPMPSRAPDYRFGRSHSDFLMNLKIPAALIKRALLRAWDATEPLAEIPLDQIAHLARHKYGSDNWNFKF